MGGWVFLLAGGEGPEGHTFLTACVFINVRNHKLRSFPPPAPLAVVEVVRCIGGASVSHVVDVFRGELAVCRWQPAGWS